MAMPKKPFSNKQDLTEEEKSFQNRLDIFDSILRHLDLTVKKIDSRNDTFIKKTSLSVTELVKKMKEFEEIIKKVKTTNENVDESLCNVLLAIRQNEYLQAWYPEQHGYPEMKVTGIHPAKIQGKNAAKS